MTNEIGVSPGTSMNSSAFSKTIRNQEFWYLCPPTVHMSAMLTGGLKNMYESIRKRVNSESCNEVLDKSPSSTDDNGTFTCFEDMPLIAQRYEYSQTLTYGRTAIVIQAKDTFMQNRLVAIKILHDHNFLVGGQEADIHKRIQRADANGSISILRLLNMFRMNEHYCLVFYYCNPIPLNHYFLTQGWIREMSLKPLKAIGRRLFKALDFLHKLDIIHADLKPENLLLNKENKVWLIDFGNSIKCTAEEIGLYEEDYDVQTLNYRAPEVTTGHSIGVGIDLWSAGCLLAELYLGQPLFRGTTQTEILQSTVDTLGFLPQEYLLGKYGKKYEILIGVTPSLSDVRSFLHQRLQCENMDFIHLLSGLLRYKPEDRMTAFEALHSRIFQDD